MTGAAGFAGGYIVRQLLAANLEIANSVPRSSH